MGHQIEHWQELAYPPEDMETLRTLRARLTDKREYLCFIEDERNRWVALREALAAVQQAHWNDPLERSLIAWSDKAMRAAAKRIDDLQTVYDLTSTTVQEIRTAIAELRNRVEGPMKRRTE